MAEGGDGGGRLDFERAITATVVADVQISPDGRRVAYATTAASKEGALPSLTIWLVDAAGGPSRRLTTSGAINAAPRWSPDGRTLAFLSDRHEPGKPQLYVLPLDGGEAVRLTGLPGGVGEPQWSPDGTKLAFLAREAETEDEKKRREERDDPKVADAAWKRQILHVLDAPAEPTALAEGALPEARRLSPEGLHIGLSINPNPSGFSWAPDSAGLVAVVGRGPKADDNAIADLAAFDLHGGMRRLGSFEAVTGRPTYSPDGETIAFIACDGPAPAMFALQTLPAAGGAARVLLPGFRGSCYAHAPLPDGRLLALFGEGQTHRLRLVDPAGGGAEPALAAGDGPENGGALGFALSVSADGRRVAFVRGDDRAHGDVHVAEIGGAARRLTDLNPWTREQRWGEVRDLAWTAPDGLEIEGLLVLPVGYREGRRYPLLLQIHGGPAGAWAHSLLAGWHDWAQFMAQRGYATLLPNPRGSTGRDTAFTCSIVGCYGDPDWHDLMAGVDRVIALGIADPDQLVVGGWSGGGYLTNVTITRTDRFKAAVSGAGIANWVSFQGTADVRTIFNRYFADVAEDPEVHWRYSPIRTIKAAKTPTLILYGEADDRVPVSQGYELYEGLKSRGVETQLVAYPREPHGIGERKHQLDLLRRVTAWFDRHLGRTVE
ncbi:MAG: tolB protein precursor, periplasmic protein involved in the tonb-independent uptake of group A colicins [uncultured Thermomicrobiales bacterium]|uniref:TolB protein, periplasmic protein involved in the tonb-independent uptake of group A colicins n=1 Tax=uncultured Thermomicrobiales bacterium TaxID=1645740 RepID=A0A6J4VTH3_9BACT|nr:MAG: tolB protein precursor, periplasmic protein involved in the tonb-independent uptake of group A colicins [uncultured Thermomicrobiales bacterium]